jgi:hypothetical protein
MRGWGRNCQQHCRESESENELNKFNLARFLCNFLKSKIDFGKIILDKWTAAVLNINSASKVLEKNTFLLIKMASESHFKTIQHLTRFSAIY